MIDPIVTKSEIAFSTLSITFRRDFYRDPDSGEAWTDLAITHVANDAHDLTVEEQHYLVEQIIESNDGVEIVNAILNAAAGGYTEHE